MLPALNPSEIASVAAVVIVALIGIGTHTETRTMLGAVVVALLVPMSPAAVVGWGVMSLMIYGVRFIWISR